MIAVYQRPCFMVTTLARPHLGSISSAAEVGCDPVGRVVIKSCTMGAEADDRRMCARPETN
jgi:hypothetical protein